MCIRDRACREHDIAYSKYKDNERRRVADRVLAGKAWERVKALNSGISERAYAAAVAAAMKAKSALGSGLCCGGGVRKRRRRASRRKSVRRTIIRRRRTTTGTGRRRRRTGSGGKKASGIYLRPYRKN